MRIYMAVGICIVLLLAGCTGANRDTSIEGGQVSGTDGLVIDFAEGHPLDEYVVDDQEHFSVIVEIENRGSYPQNDDRNLLSQGQIYLSGFDPNIIDLDANSERLESQFLFGRSTLNTEGGFQAAEFKGYIDASNVIIDKYEPTIMATACYPYLTRVSPTVCIDPYPFDRNRKKVCQIENQRLSSQGAPLVVAKIDQEAASGRMQFKITIENRGDGDVLSYRGNTFDKCNPSNGQGISRDDLDKVELVRANVGYAPLECGPFAERPNIIKLHDDEAFIICSLSFEDLDQGFDEAYSTPLNLEFRYGYRTTTTKNIEIAKITNIR